MQTMASNIEINCMLLTDPRKIKMSKHTANRYLQTPSGKRKFNLAFAMAFCNIHAAIKLIEAMKKSSDNCSRLGTTSSPMVGDMISVMPPNVESSSKFCFSPRLQSFLV